MPQPFDDDAPVLIVGGGPVGLTLAALLAGLGVRSRVVEADAGYCTGSRAICISRRSLEILGWAGAAPAVVDKGLPWTGGRSHFRDREVLHFRMPSHAGERFAPMVNIQQFYVERFVHEALQRQCGEEPVLWGSRAVGLRHAANGVELDVRQDDGPVRTLRSRWLVACDGGRSVVREAMGLRLEGVQYDGQYVIVDIEQATQRPVERLAWFDPPSNPGSTVLMHRQPDNVWRIDYQVRDDEDPAEAVKPENVLPRVRSHLAMIGETAPWQPLWISLYSAKCLTLERYRHGPVLFAGDAAHLVPIFGVRGLNSGLDDAGNLAWKLARVVHGRAGTALLDSYSHERVQAARENMAYGAKSTEFMAPPDFAFKLMRDATLRLSLHDERVRSLINPRQSAPVAYAGSPLNEAEADADGDRLPALSATGQPAPEARLLGPRGPVHLSECFGRDFTLLCTGTAADAPALPSHDGLQVLRIVPPGTPAAAGHWVDVQGEVAAAYGGPGTACLVRPDGYVLGRWRRPGAQALQAALQRALERCEGPRDAA